jgi:hypothetical protein
MGSRSEDDLPGTVDAEELEDDEVDLEDIDEPPEDDLVASIERDLAPEYEDEDEDDDPTPVIPPEVALEDPDDAGLDDDEEAVGPIVVDDENAEDDGNEEVLREGEFICASCHLVKGPTQLAAARRGLCVDCV